MASYTPNINLKKPTTSEMYNVLDWNDNWDKVDTAIGNINSQIANLPDVSYTSIAGDSLANFEASLNSALDGMATGDVRVCPAIASYSQSLTNGGQSVAFLSKTATNLWWCFLIISNGVKAGYKSGSNAWTWI